MYAHSVTNLGWNVNCGLYAVSSATLKLPDSPALLHSRWMTSKTGAIVSLQSMPFHRWLVAVWHVLTLILLVWAFTAWREGSDVHWIWIPLFATPLLVLFATFSAMQPNHRSIAYWVLAAISIPTAASGLTSVVGWMFILSVVMLIWAARRENPADDLVQM